MTQIDTLNEGTKEAIEELRIRLKNALTPTQYEDTLMFYRFLKARYFNVDKAEEMLRQHLVWRKVFQVDTYLEHFKCTEVFQRYSDCFIGFDKEGNFVSYVASGKITIKDLLKCLKMNDHERHLIYAMERNIRFLKAENEKTGRNNYQGTLIIDLDKLTLANAAYKGSADVFLKLSQMMQDNYAERMRSVYIINAPAYYIIIFSLLKRVMSNDMIQKIQVFGQSGWKEALLKVIDADVLPAFLGGTRTDPDGNPLCLSFIYHGGKIPSKYYLTHEERWFKDISQVNNVLVLARDKCKIPVEVKNSGSLIRWEFEANGKDIGFGLFFEDSEKECEILPIHRFSTADGTESYFHKAKSAGKYTIVFDNSYSWMTSKEIRYCVTVEKLET